MSKRDKLFDKFFLKKSKKVSPEILTLIDEDVQKQSIERTNLITLQIKMLLKTYYFKDARKFL